MFNDVVSPGVIKGAKISGSAGGDLGISAGGGLSINVATGQTWAYGRWYMNDSTKNVALATADPSLPRIDALVIKMDASAKTIAAVAVTGTPASSPVAPTLTQTSSTWMIPLGTARVNAGATTPTSITDTRVYAAAIPPTNLLSGTTLNGQTIAVANGSVQTNLNADLLDGKTATDFVQVGAGNEAATPVVILITDVLPAAGTKGRIAIKTPFSMP